MGSYGTQPDFITQASAVTPSNTINATTKLNSSSLWVGAGGDITVILAGTVAAAGSGFPTAGQAVVFKGVQNGTYLPVVVDYVLVTAVNPAADIVACK